ncbi:MAG: chemotaxis protein CheW [Eubacteriales bacterium]|jgi:chemotaxis signal transduction protein|nr:chemotaxis protein CheW [Bacillota bacterium]MBU4597881.1 chemotaxis protein CheW [Pseudomonadota bacterium]MBV1728325.1 chemotaxis protein CheW [Desulforudis sp.]MDP3050482.1 chemotaxis protein CheW [Eubacteriales bacterium]MDQ7789625.1 chemotaxis protein CheW [Clostridia bacterium]
MQSLVIFEVGGEMYQLPQACVSKILRFWEYCEEPVPGSDGMIVYKGQRVKAIDVRRHAGVEQVRPTFDTRIILLNRMNGLVGLLVDRVISDEEMRVGTGISRVVG